MDLVQERINKGKCPICNGDYGTEFQVVDDSKYGKVWVCKKHYVKQV